MQRVINLDLNNQCTYRITRNQMAKAVYTNNLFLNQWKIDNFTCVGTGPGDSIEAIEQVRRDYYIAEYKLNGKLKLGISKEKASAQIDLAQKPDFVQYQDHPLIIGSVSNLLPDFNDQDKKEFFSAHTQDLRNMLFKAVSGSVALELGPDTPAVKDSAKHDNYAWKDKDTGKKYLKIFIDAFPIFKSAEIGAAQVGQITGPIEATYELVKDNERDNAYGYQLLHIDTDNEDINKILLHNHQLTKDELEKKYYNSSQQLPDNEPISFNGGDVKFEDFSEAGLALDNAIAAYRLLHNENVYRKSFITELEKLQLEITNLRKNKFAAISHEELNEVCSKTIEFMNDQNDIYKTNTYLQTANSLKKRSNLKIVAGIMVAVVAAGLIAASIAAIVFTCGAGIAVPLAATTVIAALTVNGTLGTGATLLGIVFIAGALGSIGLFKRAKHERSLSHSMNAVIAAKRSIVD